MGPAWETPTTSREQASSTRVHGVKRPRTTLMDVIALKRSSRRGSRRNDGDGLAQLQVGTGGTRACVAWLNGMPRRRNATNFNSSTRPG
jgi:hypothetical protein